MRLPDGCGDKSGETVKLNKVVYGLKQAGRQADPVLFDGEKMEKRT